MKTIVTHIGCDVDNICSVWLIKRILPGFSKAKIVFVPAGQTLEGKNPDESKDVVHVDTGFGRFDHHKTDEDTCAAKLVFEYLEEKGLVKKNQSQVLKRLTEVVNEIDHFRQVFLKEAINDRFEFFLEAIIDGLKLKYPQDDQKIIEIGIILFDAIFKQLSNKIWAEKIIKAEGVKFRSPWGRAIGVETLNDESVHLAQKLGYRLVIRKDPKKGYVRIKSWPIPRIDLSELYHKLRIHDSQATWYLHPSRHMILNGSTKNPEMKPTKLSLKEIIEIIKRFKK